MKTKNELIDLILSEISDLGSPALDGARTKQLIDFINFSVNGGRPNAYLVTRANLGDNNKGIIVYILTDSKLIKIDISAKEILSNIYPLNTLIGIERKLIDGQEQFGITFQNGSFGLKYSQDNYNISEFFRKIDQIRNS